jgi:hypothetical protein
MAGRRRGDEGDYQHESDGELVGELSTRSEEMSFRSLARSRRRPG